MGVGQDSFNGHNKMDGTTHQAADKAQTPKDVICLPEEQEGRDRRAKTQGVGARRYDETRRARHPDMYELQLRQAYYKNICSAPPAVPEFWEVVGLLPAAVPATGPLKFLYYALLIRTSVEHKAIFGKTVLESEYVALFVATWWHEDPPPENRDKRGFLFPYETITWLEDSL